MLRHKHIDRVCILVLVLTLVTTALFTAGAATGVITQDSTMGYEQRLFSQDRVHTIDIVMADWDAFLDTCAMEEYAACTLVIDGEKYGNVAIRGKGNTSLSSVASYGNDRYSFKVEFDHYQSGLSYHGLDKLSLNNLIQDTTYMKDYWAYTLMNRMGVPAPLCSFVQINVNGQPWGLYLAVEGVEDSFLQRNYGSDHGELYKPDSMSFGGGRGNGMDFDFDEVAEDFGFSFDGNAESTQAMDMPGGFSMPQMPDMGNFGGFGAPGEMPSMPDANGGQGFELPADFEMPSFGGGFGMGSDDVQLIYSDDDPASYANIFNNAKTDITPADQARLIASIKAMNEGNTDVVDTEEVIRYLVVHNFLCNEDSYTGMMVHNYYLYEEDGVLAMIPWDYNLALGGFTGGDNATSTVNGNISRPVSMGTTDSRPMVAWIMDGGEYEQQYYDLYQQFISDTFASGWFDSEYDRVVAMIDSYVKEDVNGFFTYEEWQKAEDIMLEFCQLRAQSVQNQLDGNSGKVDASHLSLSAMGGMNTGGFGGGPNQGGSGREKPRENRTEPEAAATAAPTATAAPEMPAMPEGMTAPEGFEASSGMPADMGSSGDSAEMPDEFASSGGETATAEPTASPVPEPAATAVPQQNMDSSGGSSGQPAATDAPTQPDAPQETPGASRAEMPQRRPQSQNNNGSVMLLAGSLAVLLIGLIFAGCYKSKLQ